MSLRERLALPDPERPTGADVRKDWLIYGAALAFVPLFWLLFMNLMAYVPPAAGQGIIGYFLSLPIMGKLMFGTFLVAVPGILIWAATAGSKVYGADRGDTRLLFNLETETTLQNLDAMVPLAKEIDGIVFGPSRPVRSQVTPERLFPPGALAGRADGGDGRHALVPVGVAQRQRQGAVAAHGMAGNAHPIRPRREI